MDEICQQTWLSSDLLIYLLPLDLRCGFGVKGTVDADGTLGTAMAEFWA